MKEELININQKPAKKRNKNTKEEKLSFTVKEEFTKNMIEIKRFLEIIKNNENKEIALDTLLDSRSLLNTFNDENDQHRKYELTKREKYKKREKKSKFKNQFSDINLNKSLQSKYPQFTMNFKEYYFNYDKKVHSFINNIIQSTIQLNLFQTSNNNISSRAQVTLRENDLNNKLAKKIKFKNESPCSSTNEKYIFSFANDKIDKIPKINKIEEKIDSCMEDQVSCETDKFEINLEHILSSYKDYPNFKEFIGMKEDMRKKKSNEIKKEINYKENILKNLEIIVIKKYTINNDIPLNSKFYDVLCINCYECVKLDDCDNHSQICVVKPNTEFAQTSYKHSNINTKIYKIYKGLMNLGDLVYKARNNEIIGIYDSFLQITIEVYKNNHCMEILNDSVVRLTNDVDKLINKSYLSYSFSFYFPLSLYSQRIVQLIYEKLSLISQGYILTNEHFVTESSTEQEDLTERSNKIQLNQKYTCKYTIKNKSENSQKLFEKESSKLNKIQDISSNVISKKSIYTCDQTSSLSSMTNDKNFHIELNSEQFSNLNKEDELKKYFYSIGLYLKLKYSDIIHDQITILDLYQKARFLNIDVSHWNSFIRMQLNIN